MAGQQKLGRIGCRRIMAVVMLEFRSTAASAADFQLR